MSENELKRKRRRKKDIDEMKRERKRVMNEDVAGGEMTGEIGARPFFSHIQK